MKKLAIKIIEQFNGLFITLSHKKTILKKNRFYFTKLNISDSCTANIEGSNLRSSEFYISGQNSKLLISNATITNSLITVSGENNEVIIEDGVLLRQSNIIIRGSNCVIKIGEKSTFGGMRAVNVGTNCEINIGTGCLFSDGIEIWSSDTHTIFDSEGTKINPDRSINIGNDVWVGASVTILKGVDIGNGAIIGMRSVVVNNVEPKTISAGHPNKEIKKNVNWKLEY